MSIFTKDNNLSCLEKGKRDWKKMFVSLKKNRPKVFGVISYLLIGLFFIDVVARFLVGGNYVGP